MIYNYSDGRKVSSGQGSGVRVSLASQTPPMSKSTSLVKYLHSTITKSKERIIYWEPWRPYLRKRPQGLRREFHTPRRNRFRCPCLDTWEKVESIHVPLVSLSRLGSSNAKDIIDMGTLGSTDETTMAMMLYHVHNEQKQASITLTQIW